jgi:hypothetical protein
LHAGGFRVKNAVAANRFRLGVGEQRVIDLMPVGEKLQDFFGVITDGGKFDSLLYESRISILQLDQLPFAEGSPIGGAEKQEHGPIAALERVEGLHFAKLITHRESWSLLSDGQTNQHDFHRFDADCISRQRSLNRNWIAEMSSDLILGIEAVHDASGVVVECELRARQLLKAVGSAVESLICVAGAGDDNAGPGAGCGRWGWLCLRRKRAAAKCEGKDQRGESESDFLQAFPLAFS